MKIERLFMFKIKMEIDTLPPLWELINGRFVTRLSQKQTRASSKMSELHVQPKFAKWNFHRKKPANLRRTCKICTPHDIATRRHREGIPALRRIPLLYRELARRTRGMLSRLSEDVQAMEKRGIVRALCSTTVAKKNSRGGRRIVPF